MKDSKDFQIPEPLTEEIKQELREIRDNVLETIGTFLNVQILLGNTTLLKDFTQYINRYTASEVQFLIERSGYKADIEKIIDKIESDLGEE